MVLKAALLKIQLLISLKPYLQMSKTLCIIPFWKAILMDLNVEVKVKSQKVLFEFLMENHLQKVVTTLGFGDQGMGVYFF